MDPAELGRAAVTVMVAQMQASLAAFGVKGFDHWAYESALHEGDPSPVARTLAILSEHGYTYTSEGALWLRTTEFGDDKDRVLVRSSGEHTYFASDIAYHQDKRERGFDRQIDVWGADHHGYVPRMKAAYEALGGDPEQLELLIMQLVHLVRRGERAQMSKRAGEFVTLDELLAEIGVTRCAGTCWPARTTRPSTSTWTSRASSPARTPSTTCSTRTRASFRSSRRPGPAGGGNRGGRGLADATDTRPAPLHAAERALIELLLAFPAEVAEAAERRAPHLIAAYALELAQGFTAFYRDCRVVGAEPGTVESRRIALCVASRRTIACSLELLGVSAPQEM